MKSDGNQYEQSFTRLGKISTGIRVHGKYIGCAGDACYDIAIYTL